MGEHDLTPFAEILREGWYSDKPHGHRLIWCAAIVATALQKAGIQATMVGGSAIEFHAPAVYTTGDIDFVVNAGLLETLAPVMQALGFARKSTHSWALDESLWVDFPGDELEVPVETHAIGPYQLRVLPKEIAVGYRVVGFRYWKTWAYGVQAIALMRAFGSDFDEGVLQPYLKKEGSEHAYRLLRQIADSNEEITAQQLDALWHRHYR